MGVPIPQHYVVDLTGSVIDRLTVIKEVNPYQALNGAKQWYCKCECGEECIRTTKVLVHKTEVSKPKSCGTCYKCMDPGTSRGKLTIINTVDGTTYHKLGNPFSYNVQCECGAVTIMTEVEFRNRKYCTKCDDRWEYVKQVNTKHGNAPGGKRTKLLGAWQNMKNRAKKDNITICDEWFNDFLVFSDWAWENGYREDISMSLCREDVNDGFNPDNCFWVTKSEKLKNSNIQELIGGKSIFEWCLERIVDTASINRQRKEFDNDSDKLLMWLKSKPFRCSKNIEVTTRQIKPEIARNYIEIHFRKYGNRFDYE